MKMRFEEVALLVLAAMGLAPTAIAQTGQSPAPPTWNEQQEADYRVIAARCGSPAFEKTFFKQSKAAVSAGLFSKTRTPAEVEKTITALRRSPFVLVAAPSDCPAQLIQLAALQKSRSTVVRTSRAHAPGRR